MELARLISALGRFAPLKDSEEWDYPGFQDGPREKRRAVHRIALALDLIPEAMERLEKERPDLLLTHHPFYFGKPEDIRRDFPWKEKLHEFLLDRGIAVYSYHTCFDKARGGMNDTLMECLGLVPQTVADDPYLRIAEADFSSLDALLSRVKEAFRLPSLGFIRGRMGPIRRLGIIGGGASGMYASAIANACDCFLSGDCSHHQRIEMKEAKLNFIELPHECEEAGFLRGMARQLWTIDPRLEIIPLELQKPMERS